MRHVPRRHRSTLAIVTLLGTAACLSRAAPAAAQSNFGIPVPPPPDAPVELATAEVPAIRVVPVVGGLEHPWGMAFRANGDVLVTEREVGRLRIIRDGRLLGQPVPGVPEVYSGRLRAGLMDVAVHPDDDAMVYLTYSKPVDLDGMSGFTVALARGRLVGDALTEVTDLFVADGFDLGIAASKLLFAPDGTLFMSLGGSYVFAGTGDLAQDPGSHYGKLLRLNADGSTPVDNPFVGRPGYQPQIYSLGHRNQLGLTFHPVTGELWATENGPQGGDEVNIIRAGANYGWPLASYSRQYQGPWVTGTPWRDDFVAAEVLWWPSIAPSGLAFYSGDAFPAWQGNLFVGSMMVGRMRGTGHLERIVFNDRGEEIRREWLLADFKQRVRDVRVGPDGFIYLLTEQQTRLGADPGTLMRIEPVEVPRAERDR
jgi:glucose/arabinose dehydrogenase